MWIGQSLCTECSQEGWPFVLSHWGIFRKFCSFVSRLTSAYQISWAKLGQIPARWTCWFSAVQFRKYTIFIGLILQLLLLLFCLMKRESRFYSSNTVGFTVVCGLAGSLLSSPEELIKKSKFIYYQCIYEVFSIFLCF